MSVHASEEFRHPAEAVEGAARHLRVWLAASGLPYDARVPELFARAHPLLFGRDCEVVVRGYERWRWRNRLHDTAAAFARYIAPRHHRWISTNRGLSTMAPCLIGSGTSVPCWTLSDADGASAASDELRPAA